MDGDGPEPIEVELVAHEPRSDRSGRWHRQPEPNGPVEPAPESEQRPARPGSDRTRLVLVAAVAAALALVLGWMIGRTTTSETDVAADDAPGATRVTTTTVGIPFETLPIVGEEIGGADFDEPAADEPAASERSDAGPTTTEEVGPTVESIGVDERLAGVPVRLVGVELGGILVEADLATGTLTDYRADRVNDDGSPLVIGPDWVISSSFGRTLTIRSDGTTAPIDLGDSWQVLHLPDTELFWRVPSGGPLDEGLVLTMVGLDGERVGPELELPFNTWPMMVDPASGGVVVGNVSRNYTVTPDGVEYLGVGAIIGITDDVLVTYDCDEALACSLFRTDRATGSIAAVPPDADLDEPYQWGSASGWGGTDQRSVSPDGRWVAVVGSSWRTSVAGIVELETGRFVELTRLSSPPAVAWSPDSRWAFTLDDQVVTAYDTVTGDRFPVFTDVVRWVRLGARPLVPATDARDHGSEGATLLRVVPGATRNASGFAEEPVEG
jgi:hypothetical protein